MAELNQEAILLLQNTKANLKNSINAKGGVIEDTTSFSEYSGQVDNFKIDTNDYITEDLENSIKESLNITKTFCDSVTTWSDISGKIPLGVLTVPLIPIDGSTMYASFQKAVSVEVLPNFNTTNVTNFGACFAYTTSLKKIPDCNFSNGTTFQQFASNTFSLKYPIAINAKNATDYRQSFASSSIPSVTLLGMENVTTLFQAFYACPYLTKVELNGTTENLIDIDYMFYGSKILKSIKGVLNCKSIVSAKVPFALLYALEDIELSNVNFDVTFAQSPLLTQESILSIAYACGSESAHTITFKLDDLITTKLDTNCKLNDTNDGLIVCESTDVDTLGTVREYIVSKGWTVIQ